jgi:carbonic anhydrase
VAKAQTPLATIITCSDSRVPPELLFGGLGVGELFVARNAGNMVDLGVPLIVVMGHERCGAVAAACEVVEKHTKLPGSIGPMVNAIVPAAKAVRSKLGDCVDNTVCESAKRADELGGGKEVSGDLSKRVATRRQSLMWQKKLSILCCRR